jgi:selenide,water dikinase
VTGTIHPQKIITNRNAQIGDAIILTKPIGTGVISTGIKFGKADDATVKASLDTMLLAGREASALMREFRAHAATDVTGFSLLGHAWEVARASNVTLELESSSVPTIPGALELAARGLITSGDKTNRAYVGAEASLGDAVSPELSRLLFDPQTAGGLLISIDESRADELLARLRQTYPRAARIGRVTGRGSHAIVVK